MLDREHFALCEGMVSSATSHYGKTYTLLFVASVEYQEEDHTGRSCVRCKGSSNRREVTRTKYAIPQCRTVPELRCASLDCLFAGFLDFCSNNG